MQKYQRQSLSQRFQQYQASKTVLFWACAGSVIAATIVGFSWGGWVTGGSAKEMAEDAAAQGRQEVAAAVCVDRFMATPDAGIQLTALQEMTSSYARGRFVQDGGWASMSASSTDNRKAAGLCAEALAERDTSGPGEAAQIDGEATAAQ